MSSTTLITTSELSRLIGLSQAPAIVDMRTHNHFRADPRLLPASQRMDFHAISQWYSRIFKDDLPRLEAARSSATMPCRNPRDGTHNWPSQKPN